MKSWCDVDWSDYLLTKSGAKDAELVGVDSSDCPGGVWHHIHEAFRWVYPTPSIGAVDGILPLFTRSTRTGTETD